MEETSQSNAATTPPPTLFVRIRGHSGNILRLAGPVVVARSGMMILALADTIMVGRYSAQELAYQSIGLAPIMAIMVAGFGLIQGTQVMTAFNMGAGTPQECGAVWRRSLVFAGLIGCLSFILTLFGELFFNAVGQDPDIAEHGGDVLLVVGLSLPPMLIFVSSSYFLEGLRRPKPAMLMMVAANIVNVFLNWLLIYGNLGAPEMGALGSAWATTGVRIFMAVMIVGYIWYLHDHERFAIRVRAAKGWRLWAQQRRIGYGAGASSAVEASAFAAMNLFAGLISAVALGAFAISLNILAIAFMAALGLGAATAVNVGSAHGRNDISDVTLAGWTGVGLTILILTGIGGVLYFASLAGRRLYHRSGTLGRHHPRRGVPPICASDGWRAGRRRPCAEGTGRNLGSCGPSRNRLSLHHDAARVDFGYSPRTGGDWSFRGNIHCQRRQCNSSRNSILAFEH